MSFYREGCTRSITAWTKMLLEGNCTHICSWCLPRCESCIVSKRRLRALSKWSTRNLIKLSKNRTYLLSCTGFVVLNQINTAMLRDALLCERPRTTVKARVLLFTHKIRSRNEDTTQNWVEYTTLFSYFLRFEILCGIHLTTEINTSSNMSLFLNTSHGHDIQFIVRISEPLQDVSG
jgi:hypothetical protein